MAVDRDRQRQMACKVVKMGKSPQRQFLWREVELLKDISHVRKVLPLSTLADQTSSQISYTSSVFFSRTDICMAIARLPGLELTDDIPPAISFQTLSLEETLCLTWNDHGLR